ncbi:MAG: glutathione peroxidase [Chlorobiaceae bacterium]|nr:glutathione peroxidase [Chlorobiaceae bacterium]MBA4310476.1 glutathione peroxidase [Chlorobiaceae bacterium]
MKRYKSNQYNLVDNINGIVVRDIDGNEVNLSDYNGRVLLIVNVASACGFTKQYEGLEAIYSKYKERGFEVLAFPSNDFGSQETGTNEEIKLFCTTKFGVTFQLFSKIKTKGDDKEKLYQILSDNPVTGTGNIRWNFEKFLIDKNGKIVQRFKSSVNPSSDEITNAIEQELAK